MIRTLIVLCLVPGGVDAFGQEKEEENKRAKKEKKSEEWYGIAAGLSQFYLKDELGSYLRYDGQTRSLAGLSLTETPKSLWASFFTLSLGKLYASETSVNIVYFQISCGKSIIGGDFDPSPERNFEIFWREFNDFYASFEIKNIDWDALYRVHRPSIAARTTPQELFDILSAMLEHLNDGHVALVSPFATFSSRTSGVKRNPTIRVKLEKTHKQGRISYGIIRDHHIGYILIPGFSTGSSVKSWERDIDAVLEQLHNTPGIIVDLRVNPGGVVQIARAVMARFMDTTHVYGYEQFRKRPARSDFTPLFELQTGPAGERQYTNPIVLLVGKNTASAAEDFVLALRQRPHVTVVGSPTAGALGLPKKGQLPNGWTYQLTVSKVFTVDMISYEGIGIPPDIAVSFSDPSDTGDPVLEKGIQVLEGKFDKKG